jgi:hypothetical protein
VCIHQTRTLLLLRHVLSFFQLLGYQNSTGRLTPCDAYLLRAMLTKTAHALRTWSAHHKGALSTYPRGSCPADTTNSCPWQVAPRHTRTALLAHTHPLAEHPNQNPKHPSTDLPPPPPYPPRITATAPRSSRRRRHGGTWKLNAFLPVPHSVCSPVPLGVNDGSPHLQPACTRLPRRKPRCPRGRRGR